jgi:hypothetical protein
MLDRPTMIDAVGPYILEGSKPGAAACACWLAHKALTLDHAGHGQVLLGTLLSAGKLGRYLDFHRHLYRQWEEELPDALSTLDTPDSRSAFTFVRLFSPDTNVVCFVAVPMAVQANELIRIDASLESINKLNRAIYQAMGRPPAGEEGGMPYGHPFFLSRTEFVDDQYPASSLSRVLDRLGVDGVQYGREGLFVLRCTVMNPHYHLAHEDTGVDYLYEFVRNLHKVTRLVLRSPGG